VYPLPDDPERCLEDFLEVAAAHARRMAEQLGRQEASVQRFLELSGDDFAEAG
jgi:predicted transcriptional regulator